MNQVTISVRVISFFEWIDYNQILKTPENACQWDVLSLGTLLRTYIYEKKKSNIPFYSNQSFLYKIWYWIFAISKPFLWINYLKLLIFCHPSFNHFVRDCIFYMISEMCHSKLTFSPLITADKKFMRFDWFIPLRNSLPILSLHQNSITFFQIII